MMTTYPIEAQEPERSLSFEQAAEANISALEGLRDNIESQFLVMGELLLLNEQKGYWAVHGNWHSFADFCLSLGFKSYSQARRLMNMAKAVHLKRIKYADALDIGSSKMTLLLPLLRHGSLDEDTIEVAKAEPYRNLAEYLGRKFPDRGRDLPINCPQCGFEIAGCPRCHMPIRGVKFGSAAKREGGADDTD